MPLYKAKNTNSCIIYVNLSHLHLQKVYNVPLISRINVYVLTGCTLLEFDLNGSKVVHLKVIIMIM